MSMRSYQPGDYVYAKEDLFNDDGGAIHVKPGALLARRGCRGLIVKVGHADGESQPPIYLVRFESKPDELGPPIGCLPEELTQEQSSWLRSAPPTRSRA